MSRALRRHYAAGGATHDVDLVQEQGRLRAHVDGDEVWLDARVVRSFAGGAEVVVVNQGGRSQAVVVRDGDTVHVAMRGRTYRLAVVASRPGADGPAEADLDPFVASPMTGVVRQVLAGPGEARAAGETLVVVEAMKMEFAVEAPRDVLVDEVRVKAGDRVEIGQVLVTFRESAAT